METFRLSHRPHDLHDVSLARHAGPLSRFPPGSPQSDGSDAGKHGHPLQHRRGDWRGDLRPLFTGCRASKEHGGCAGIMLAYGSDVGVWRTSGRIGDRRRADAGRCAGSLGRDSGAFERIGGGCCAWVDAWARVPIRDSVRLADKFDSIRTPRPRRISMGDRRLRDHYDSDAGDIALERLRGTWPELCARHAIGCGRNRALNELSLVWAECRKALVQACSEMQTVSPSGGGQRKPVLRFVYRAPLAQLDRASGYEPEGREFESLRARHISPIKTLVSEKQAGNECCSRASVQL